MDTLTTSISDSILIDQYLNGSEAALEKLISRHKAKIFNYINSKVQDRDTAEDIFQDTFIKVIKTVKGGHYNEEGKFLPWVMRIAHNLVIDFFRKSNRMPKVKISEEFDIEFLDLTEIFVMNKNKKLTNSEYKDRHPNSYAHKIFANNLYKYLLN